MEQTIKNFTDPHTGLPWKDTVGLKIMQPDADSLTIEVTLGYPIAQAEKTLREAFSAYCARLLPNKHINLQLRSRIRAHQTQPNVSPLPGIANILVVSSGKGGVGKSTTAVNLALGLRAHGARVGLLDADIHGPNQPQMLGFSGDKPQVADKKFVPIQLHGLPTMSIGYLVDAQQATIWRGPMVSGALQQMINDTAWPVLDYLVIDMPPGTGDIQLTLAQKVPVSGAVIVTTPQNVALQDARKGVTMFKKLDIPTLGVVENMSYYHCPQCGHRDALFGEGGGARLAEQQLLDLLGKIPLYSEIQRLSDQGRPALLYGDPAIKEAYLDLALRVAAKLSLQPRNYAAKFGHIKVEHDERA